MEKSKKNFPANFDNKMDAFEVCNKIWEKNGEEFFEKYGEIMAEVKITAYRGQVVRDWS